MEGRMGCTDVVQCFDPVRHYGATAARFHNFLSRCLRNRLRTILAKLRLEPLSDPRNLNIKNSEAAPENTASPGATGEIDEAYLLRHSATFAVRFRQRARAENPVLRRYVNEVEEFAAREDRKLLTVVQAIQRSRTLREAERRSGMSSRDFRRCRRELSLLKQGFPQRRHQNEGRTRKAFQPLEVFVGETRKVFLREEAVRASLDDLRPPAGEGVWIFRRWTRGNCATNTRFRPQDWVIGGEWSLVISLLVLRCR